jgi:predicted transcriptional regulator
MDDDKLIYTLTEKGDSMIPNEIESMDEWLTNMDDDVLESFYKICNKTGKDRSDNEDYTICSYALVLYCRELGLNELGITNELMYRLSGTFCVNVIVEKLRRKGYVETNSPLLLYKDSTFSLTKEGREFMEKGG